jgi:iron complex outermembrane recepter protein
MNDNTRSSLASVTLAGMAAATLSFASHAQAPAATEDDLAEVVVTGSSIRGVAPVGSNLITMGQEEIAKIGAQNVTEILARLPAIEGFGASGRANASSSNGGVGISVYIHQLGANGSNSTLVLVDGHRVPASGVTNYLVNPNNVPSAMIERVEVLAEGASAVYGSDAVAGVVNFITRKKFDGVQLKAEMSGASGTKSYAASVLGGHSWDTGSVVGAVSHTQEGELDFVDRPFTNPLVQTARAAAAGLSGTGATNFGNFNCDPATVQPNAAGNIYLNAQGATNVTNTAANQPCSNWAYGALFPRDIRQNAMIRVSQQVGERMDFGADVVYSRRRSEQIQSRGALTANAFGVGTAIAGQANPFYTNPPGVTATRQQIRYLFDELLGPGALSTGGEDLLHGTATLKYRLTDSWDVDGLVMLGYADNYAAQNVGLVNTGLALLALNGTTQTSGNTTVTSIPGLNAITLNLPLTAANALDVWNPAATNRTSAAVRQALVNNENLNRGVYQLQQYRLSAQGGVFDLPGGTVKIAFGGEYLRTGISQDVTRPVNNAGASVGSQLFQFNFGRTDTAGYVEANIPVISPEMGIPFVQKVETNLAVRYDHYSDFGGTTNPKASFNWDVMTGLRLRGNVSTSFVAPPLNLVGGKLGLANFSNVSGGGPQGNNVPVAFYPNVTQFGIPGCTASSATCSIATLQGINSSVGDPTAIAQEGDGWSFGADITPSFAPGLTIAATLWNTNLIGGMTAPQFGARVTTASLANALTLYPNCATAADIAAFASQAPQNSVFPACVQFTYRSDTSNYLTYYARGLDLQVGYKLQTRFGTFPMDYSLTQLLKFDEGFAYKTEPTPNQVFSALNTNGFASQFPSVKTNMRGHLGWEYNGFLADVYGNFTGSYKNVNATAVTPTQSNAAGVYSGVGGDKVKANFTADLHLAYNFSAGFLDRAQIALSVNNVFDKEPPYFNSTNGFDGLVASPLGRYLTLSVSTRL